MTKHALMAEEKRQDRDLWLISLTTLGCFFLCALAGDKTMCFVKNRTLPLVLRLLLFSAHTL